MCPGRSSVRSSLRTASNYKFFIEEQSVQGVSYMAISEPSNEEVIANAPGAYKAQLIEDVSAAYRTAKRGIEVMAKLIWQYFSLEMVQLSCTLDDLLNERTQALLQEAVHCR